MPYRSREPSAVLIPKTVEDFTDDFVKIIVSKYLVVHAGLSKAREGSEALSAVGKTPTVVALGTWTAEKASQDGQNFCSYLVRLSATFQRRRPESSGDDEDDHSCARDDETAGFIVKLLPPNDAHRDAVMKGHLFEKEVEFYSQLIPELEEIARKAEPGFPEECSPRNLFPACYWAAADSRSGGKKIIYN